MCSEYGKNYARVNFDELCQEARQRFPHSPSRQRDFIIGAHHKQRTGSFTDYGRSTRQKDKLRIR